jgi:hypothetical protein
VKLPTTSSSANLRGVPNHYCAEIFINDGAIPNMLMKTRKRPVAGKYSRELGVKVLAGLKRLARPSFKQNGCPIFQVSEANDSIP